MKLQLNFVKDCTVVINKAEILETVIKMQDSGILASSSLNIRPLSEIESDDIVQALNELQGIEANRQTLSHAYGMGGVFGHGIEVRFDSRHLQPILWTGTDKDEGYLVNTALFLEQFTKCDITNQLLENNDIDAVTSYLETVNSELNYKGDNTYNYGSDFSSDMNVHSPGIEAFENFDKCIVLVALHLGGDIRGNYGNYTAYLMDYDDYCNFLNFHFGFYNENYEQYGNGYSNEPQSVFFNDFEIVERLDNQTIKARNIKTGEIVEFTCDVNF